MLVLTHKIKVSDADDFLYDYLIELLYQVKVTLGGKDLAVTLQKHPKIRNYLISKIKRKIQNVEDLYFNEDGSLNSSRVSKLPKS